MRNCSHRVSSVLVLMATAGIAVAGGRGSEERVVTRVVEKKLDAGVHYEFSRSVGSGRLFKAREGRPGSVRRTYRITMKGDRQVAKELLKEEIETPQPTLMLMGRGGFAPSRSAFMRKRVLTMSATGYDPSPATIGPGATGFTRTGRRATFGVVAVDPRVIPLNSLVFVEGYGFAIAADTGGAIKGNKIDLCFNSRSQALRHGRRPMRVHVLSHR